MLEWRGQPLWTVHTDVGTKGIRGHEGALGFGPWPHPCRLSPLHRGAQLSGRQGPEAPVPPSLRPVRPRWAPLTPDAVQKPVCSQGNKSVSRFWSCPGIPMESITVYQKIPHPGIQVNLNSYYSEQVSAVLGRTGRAGRRGVRPSLAAWSRPLAV